MSISNNNNNNNNNNKSKTVRSMTYDEFNEYDEYYIGNSRYRIMPTS